MLARLRISVPDRPGSLGRVTSAIGSAGGDIAKVDVLESEAGRALDDVFVTVRDAAHLDRLTQHRRRADRGRHRRACSTRRPLPPGTPTWNWSSRCSRSRGRSLQTLVDGAPAALGADWAALLEFGPDDVQTSVLARSLRAPEPGTITVAAPLRLGAVRVNDQCRTPLQRRRADAAHGDACRTAAGPRSRGRLPPDRAVAVRPARRDRRPGGRRHGGISGANDLGRAERLYGQQSPPESTPRPHST